MGVSQRETLEAVTDEWEVAADIADRVPKSPRVDRSSHVTAVHYDLAKLAKWGLVERLSDGVRGHPVKWRRVR